jgi:ankyrin repeat protein
MYDFAMIRRLIYGVAVFALLPVLAGCGRGDAILEASENGDAKTVERLLKKDPSLVHTRRFGPGWGPLELAARRGHTEVVALLLEAGAPMEKGAIRDAAVGGHIKIIEMFVAKGVDINGPSDLMEGAVTGGSTALVQWLLARGASVEGKPGSMGPLENAASLGHKAVAEILLAHGARADAKNEAGRTPLLMAASGGNTAIAELLIQHGAKVNDATRKGMTPLMRAADVHAAGTVKLLLERGADVNARDNDQDTALTYSMRRRLSGTAEEQAEIQRLGGQSAKKNGEEVWVWVLKRRRAAVVELLLAHGADVNARNNDQETASTLAMKKDCLSCEEVLQLLAQRSRPQ